MASKYTFNIINFTHPQDEYTFYFINKEAPGLQRVHNTLLPNEVIDHFGEQEHFYTSFDSPLDGAIAITKRCKPLQATNEDEEKKRTVKNSAFIKSLLKRYYNAKIFQYFQQKGILVKPDFINDIEVWLPITKKSDTYTFYTKTTIKVQIGVLTSLPEIQITYAGTSKVFKEPMLQLMHKVAAKSFNWLLYNNQLMHNDELIDEAKRNLDKVFPVWNFLIRDDLNQATEAPDRTNPYLKFKENIHHFYTTYINTPEFKSILPIKEGFVDVPESRLGEVTEKSNLLLFGDKKYHSVPYTGMDKYGPLEMTNLKRIQFFYIFHTADLKKVSEIHESLSKGYTAINPNTNRTATFKGVYNFTKVPYATQSNFSIPFENRDNPIPEIQEQLRKRSWDKDVTYFAIYVSPHSKNSASKEQKEIYYRIKEMLLKINISSQVIESGKFVKDYNYVFSFNNICIALLAKLNGTPWRLDVPLRNELVVGIGAFCSTQHKVKYVGSAFSFSNNGHFQSFDCFQSNQTKELAGSIKKAVKDYISLQQNLQRIVIHFYKQMSQEELQPIEKALWELNVNIPVFIVTINKTESSDIVAFDNTWEQLMPESGTYINIGNRRFLLYNNTRYKGDTFRPADGYPFPIKLYITCTEEEKAKDPRTIKELINQVYQFSRMYWKSVRQQNLPVTIKYPEMVAEIFPHFEGNEIPDFGKENLWFL